MRLFRENDIMRGNVLGEQYANEHFNGWKKTIISLINIFLVDGWYDMYSSWLKEDGTPIFDPQGLHFLKSSIPTFYFVLALFIFHFIIFNMFVGINITNVQEANNEYQAEIA